MKPAEEVQQVRENVWFWQAYDSGVKTDLSSCAVKLSGGLVLIDPIPLAVAAWKELIGSAPPAAIVLTNGNHQRAALELREKYGVPIFAHAGAQPDPDVKLDRLIEDGAVMCDELAIIHLPGFGPGEIALLLPRDGGALFVGDALINVSSHGFSLLPAKYCADPKQARQSAQKLLQFDFELMTFAHGLPIVSGAKKRLAELLS